jgi:hypothetical protein
MKEKNVVEDCPRKCRYEQSSKSKIASQLGLSEGLGRLQCLNAGVRVETVSRDRKPVTRQRMVVGEGRGEAGLL